MIRLREIAKVTAGQAAPKEFSDEGCPFIRAGHLEGLLSNLSLNDLPKVSEEVAQKKRLKKIPKGTILFAKSGMSATKNRVYITEKESYFVSHLAGILPSERFSNSYLARYLSWYNPSKLILDSAYPSIRLEDINDLSIPLPPLEEQKKIAAILDAADAYRQKTKALIDKYDQLAQSLFLDMFGDPVTNPKGWEKQLLGKVSKMKAGSFVKASDIVKSNTGNLIPCFGGNGIRGYVNSYTHEGNYVLIGRQGALCGNVKLATGKFHATEHAVVCDYIEDFNPYWLLFLLDILNLNQYSTGAAQPGLNVGALSKIDIIFPPLKNQNQFADMVTQLGKQKQQAGASLVKAEELFRSLLQKAFKGELTN